MKNRADHAAPAFADDSRRLQFYCMIFMAVVAFGYICHVASGIMIPLVVAVFLWYLINAMARFAGYAARKTGMSLPDGARYALSVLVIFGVAVFIYHLVQNNVDAVIREAPKFQDSINKFAHQIAQLLALDHTPTLEEVDSAIGDYIDVGALIRGFAAMLTGMAGKTLMVLFFVAFMLYEQRFFDRKMRGMFRSAETRDGVRHVLHTIDGKIQRYIGVKAFVSLVDGILTFGILTAVGVDFAGFWGVMGFFLHFIPYAGSFIALTMPSLVALVQYGDITPVVIVFASLSVSHAFLGQVLDPYLMGNNLNLSPIVIITNLAIWGMLWGIPGMFLAIPILAVVTITLSQFDRTRPLAVLLSKTGVIETRRKTILKMPGLR